jgi:hypothetical protein
MSIDISSTMLSLASFIARFDPQAASRLRLKFCALCDAVCDRTDTLTLRKDNPARQKILDIVMEWMQTTPMVYRSHLCCYSTYASFSRVFRTCRRPVRTNSISRAYVHVSNSWIDCRSDLRMRQLLATTACTKFLDSSTSMRPFFFAGWRTASWMSLYEPYLHRET